MLEFVFVALVGGSEEGEETSSLTIIRGEALEKLKELKDKLDLATDDFDDLDFGSSSEEDE